MLTIAASEHRTQLANRRAARERLVEVLREAAAPPPRKRRPTKPTRGSKERRLAEKKRRGADQAGPLGSLGLSSAPACRIRSRAFVEST